MEENARETVGLKTEACNSDFVCFVASQLVILHCSQEVQAYASSGCLLTSKPIIAVNN